MIYITRLIGAAVVALSIFAAPSFAAVLNIDPNGQLMGASGVDVNGTLYDVEFVDGTCAAVFSGCDEATDLTFPWDFQANNNVAEAASQALLDQVFLDGPNGLFDSRPELTNGISYEISAHVITPVYVDGMTLFGMNTRNTNSITGDGMSLTVFPSAWDLADYSPYVFARWTDAAAIPLPAGGVLLLSGLGGIAALRRRKKRAA